MRNKPKYLNEKTPQKRGREQEEKARRHINSGAVWFDKGDLDYKKMNIDTKNANKQFTLKLSNIKKHYKDSIPKEPVFLIYFKDYVIKAFIQRIVK